MIAEIGVNHDGSLAKALDYVGAAKEAGADYVKFQIFQTEQLVHQSAPLADYQRRAGSHVENQWGMLKSLELSYDDFNAIKSRCDSIGIGFAASVFDLNSLEFVAALGVDFIKLGSGELTNQPLLKACAATRSTLLLSTGMATLEEILGARDYLFGEQVCRSRLKFLHCTSAYPASPKTLNLRAMLTMKRCLGVEVGYSDHSLGWMASLVATSLGASYIEKHFTMDVSLPGPDHAASLSAEDFKRMVSDIRGVEIILGSPDKSLSAEEIANKSAVRRSLFAARDIQIGKTIEKEDIMVLRPGTGLSPMNYENLIGTRASKSFVAGDPLEF